MVITTDSLKSIKSCACSRANNTHCKITTKNNTYKKKCPGNLESHTKPVPNNCALQK